MAGCESCNSCNSCNGTCQGCNSCNSCNGTCEGSCQNSKQNVSSAKGNFKWGDCDTEESLRPSGRVLSSNSLFLSAKEWNNLLDYIYNGYNLTGNPLKSSANSIYSYNNKSIKATNNKTNNPNDNEFMTANMYNGAIAKMLQATNGNLNDLIDYQRSSNDVIYASYFESLKEYANSYFKVNYCNTCDNCNTSCNSNCLSCNSCNNCNSSCQGKNSCCYTPPPDPPAEGEGGDGG